MGAMAMAMAESAVPSFLPLSKGQRERVFLGSFVNPYYALVNPLSTLQLQIPGALPSASLPRVLYRRHLK